MLMMKKAGVPDLEILRGATIYAAEWLEADDKYGSVELGKAADLILLNGNTLEDIARVEEIYRVIHKGKVITPDGY